MPAESHSEPTSTGSGPEHGLLRGRSVGEWLSLLDEESSALARHRVEQGVFARLAQTESAAVREWRQRELSL